VERAAGRQARSSLRVLGPDRARVHDLGAGRNAVGGVPDDRFDRRWRAAAPYTARRRPVRAGDARAQCSGDQREPAHPGTRRCRRSAASAPSRAARRIRGSCVRAHRALWGATTTTSLPTRAGRQHLGMRSRPPHNAGVPSPSAARPIASSAGRSASNASTSARRRSGVRSPSAITTDGLPAVGQIRGRFSVWWSAVGMRVVGSAPTAWPAAASSQIEHPSGESGEVAGHDRLHGNRRCRPRRGRTRDARPPSCGRSRSPACMVGTRTIGVGKRLEARMVDR